MRSALLAALAVVCLSSSAQAGEPPDARRYFYLQPLGTAAEPVADEDVALVKRALTEFYGLEVRTLPRAELPAAAWYPPRRRYRAEKLLDFLRPRLPADGARILGITAVDISTTKGRYVDWGLMGLGDLDGGAAVLSTFRTRKKSRGPLHARERFAKVAVHETGHTLGLDHCPTRGCLMEDANGKVVTTDEEYDLCPLCRARLAVLGHRIPDNPHPPWPKPPH